MMTEVLASAGLVSGSQTGTAGSSGTCFSLSFLLPCLPNKPATKLFLRLATFTFSGLGFSPTGVDSSTLAGGVISPARGDALMFDRDYDHVSRIGTR